MYVRQGTKCLRAQRKRPNFGESNSPEVQLPRTPLLRGWVNSPKKPLDDLQVDLADAALDVYAEVDIGFAVGVVDVSVAHRLKSLGIDLAQATFSFCLNPNLAGQ